MAFRTKLYIKIDTFNILKELKDKHSFESFDDLISLMGILYEKSNEENINKIEQLNIKFNQTYNKSINKIIKQKQKLKAEQMTLVNNVYRFIWRNLNQIFEKPEIKLMVENVDLSIERCKINGWKYQEEQLNKLKEVLEQSENIPTYAIINRIRDSLDR